MPDPFDVRSGTDPGTVLLAVDAAGNVTAAGDITATGNTKVGASLLASGGKYGIDKNGKVQWGPGGTAAFDLSVFRRNVNELSTDGDFSLSALGGGFLIKEGANCTLGQATLVAGTITIANTNAFATTRIFVSRATAGGALGHLSVTINPGVSFTITSSSGTDVSVVNWLFLYPA